MEDIYKYKSYLFSIAYNILADVQAAEDLVQDTFEKWLSSERDNISSVKAYLSRIVVNKAIDRLEELKKQRAHYKGFWLPVPVIEEPENSEGQHTLDYGLLLLLEKLNPVERAVFVLRESLSLDYDEIASFTGATQENCRQMLHRAKEKIRDSKSRKQRGEDRSGELLQAFVYAYYNQDMQKVRELLKEDIALYSDGGGKVAAALKPLFGMEKVLKFLEGIRKINEEGVFGAIPVLVNGGPAVYVTKDDAFYALITITVQDDKIDGLFFVRNPEKIFYKKA